MCRPNQIAMRSNFPNVGEVKFHGDELPWGEMKVAWGKFCLQKEGKVTQEKQKFHVEKEKLLEISLPQEEEKAP